MVRGQLCLLDDFLELPIGRHAVEQERDVQVGNQPAFAVGRIQAVHREGVVRGVDDVVAVVLGELGVRTLPRGGRLRVLVNAADGLLDGLLRVVRERDGELVAHVQAVLLRERL